MASIRGRSVWDPPAPVQPPLDVGRLPRPKLRAPTARTAALERALVSKLPAHPLRLTFSHPEDELAYQLWNEVRSSNTAVAIFWLLQLASLFVVFSAEFEGPGYAAEPVLVAVLVVCRGAALLAFLQKIPLAVIRLLVSRRRAPQDKPLALEWGSAVFAAGILLYNYSIMIPIYVCRGVAGGSSAEQHACARTPTDALAAFWVPIPACGFMLAAGAVASLSRWYHVAGVAAATLAGYLGLVMGPMWELNPYPATALVSMLFACAQATLTAWRRDGRDRQAFRELVASQRKIHASIALARGDERGGFPVASASSAGPEGSPSSSSIFASGRAGGAGASAASAAPSAGSSASNSSNNASNGTPLPPPQSGEAVALARAGARLGELVSKTDALLLEVDGEGVVRACGPNSRALLGLEESALLLMPLMAHLHPADVSTAAAAVAEAAKAGAALVANTPPTPTGVVTITMPSKPMKASSVDVYVPPGMGGLLFGSGASPLVSRVAYRRRRVDGAYVWVEATLAPVLRRAYLPPGSKVPVPAGPVTVLISERDLGSPAHDGATAMGARGVPTPAYVHPGATPPSSSSLAPALPTLGSPAFDAYHERTLFAAICTTQLPLIHVLCQVGYARGMDAVLKSPKLATTMARIEYDCRVALRASFDALLVAQSRCQFLPVLSAGAADDLGASVGGPGEGEGVPDGGAPSPVPQPLGTPAVPLRRLMQAFTEDAVCFIRASRGGRTGDGSAAPPGSVLHCERQKNAAPGACSLPALEGEASIISLEMEPSVPASLPEADPLRVTQLVQTLLGVCAAAAASVYLQHTMQSGSGSSSTAATSPPPSSAPASASSAVAPSSSAPGAAPGAPVSHDVVLRVSGGAGASPLRITADFPSGAFGGPQALAALLQLDPLAVPGLFEPLKAGWGGPVSHSSPAHLVQAASDPTRLVPVLRDVVLAMGGVVSAGVPERASGGAGAAAATTPLTAAAAAPSRMVLIIDVPTRVIPRPACGGPSAASLSAAKAAIAAAPLGRPPPSADAPLPAAATADVPKPTGALPPRLPPVGAGADAGFPASPTSLAAASGGGGGAGTTTSLPRIPLPGVRALAAEATAAGAIAPAAAGARGAAGSVPAIPTIGGDGRDLGSSSSATSGTSTARGTADPSAAAALPNVAGLHVLFVDDEQVNRRLGARMLARLGCSHIILEDGDQVPAALARCAAGLDRPFDVVLMDILMPTNGVIVCQRIKEAGYTSLPLVAMTGQTAPRDIQRYTAAGFDLVLPKPFDIRAMSRAILEGRARRLKALQGGTVGGQPVAAAGSSSGGGEPAVAAAASSGGGSAGSVPGAPAAAASPPAQDGAPTTDAPSDGGSTAVAAGAAGAV